MELSTSSISNEIDKSVQEEFSVSQAAIYDAKLRKEKGQEPESISNEQIKKNDPILDTYKVLDDAIHGGMGSVWRVQHESWNVDLAMKRPQPRFFAEAGDGRKEEFIRECENWINLGLHPNIVSCYYVREIGGVPTIFSEWMDNGSLKDRIRDGSLYEGSEEEVQERILDIAIQTARGLKYSHENNLIHQDVKPGNILLTKDWDAKVADFGLAKAQSQLTENKKPVSTGYTIQYCPREQAEGAPAEKWMDVYAWALTVLEMYTGKRLWETGAEAKEHYERLLEQLKVRMPEGMKSLLGNCLLHNQENSSCDFYTVELELLQIYRNETQGIYPRPPYKTTSASADNLNNYAMSMLDLGNIKAAENAWDEAIRQSPDHALSIINRAFFLWHSAKLMDDDVLQIINTLPDGSEKQEALEIFAMESGEKEDSRGGTDSNDVLLIASFAYDASFEGNNHVWLAMNDRLECYDTKTGEALKNIDKNQIGEKLILVQATENGQWLYTGSTNTLFRINLHNTDQIEKMTIEPDRKSMVALYPAGTGVSGGKQYEYNTGFNKWHQIWLEKEDTILCVTEESEWEDPDDLKKYSRWCISLPHQTPVPPTVKKVREYCVLRFLLDSSSMKLISVQPIMNGEKKDWKQRDFLFRNCKTQGSKKPGDRWEALDGRLKDTATGRFVRSEKGIIKAFSPDRGQYLLISGTGKIGSKNQARICRPPEKGAGNRLYTLSRIKDIAMVQQEDETATTVYESFCRAFEGKDYKEAICSFETFRNLPDQRDSGRATEMELKLSNVCRRIRLHHYGMPVENTEVFDMSVFNPGWLYFSGSNYQEYVKMSGSLKYTKYEALAEKAIRIVESAFPIRYMNENGQSVTLDGGRTGVVLINRELTVAYVNIYNQGPAAKCALTEVDLNSGKIRVIASERGTPIMAPDGKTWVRTDMYGLHVYNGGMENYSINIPNEQDFPLFSPDSGFILYRKNHVTPDEYRLIAITPEVKDKEPYTVQMTVLPQLPKLPEGKSFRGVYFSGDGLHLMLVYGNGKINDPEISFAPWLRLSWDYALPESVNKVSVPSVEQQEKPRIPMQKQQEEKKKKSLFSRLFG